MHHWGGLSHHRAGKRGAAGDDGVGGGSHQPRRCFSENRVCGVSGTAGLLGFGIGDFSVQIRQHFSGKSHAGIWSHGAGRPGGAVGAVPCAVSLRGDFPSGSAVPGGGNRSQRSGGEGRHGESGRRIS